MMILQIEKEMRQAANMQKAKILAGFFKTSKGQYGEGDKFLGITVPTQRTIAKKYFYEISINEIQRLINSRYHEHRLLGFIMLTLKYPRATDKDKKTIYNFYLKNAKRANNWDLVDLSAPNVVGAYLMDNDRKILYKLARSKNLWEKRISIISTFTLIRAKQFDDTLKIANILMADTHDLIHKAVGWMLREVGKRDRTILVKYLAKRYKKMPRTMLRYAIEKFPEKERKYYLTKVSQ